MHLKKLQKNKKIIGIVSIAIIIGVTGFVFASQRFDGMLGASIASLSKSEKIGNSDLVIETVNLGYRQALSDDNPDANKYKRLFFLHINGVFMNKNSEPINSWFEYNTNKNFPLLTQRIVRLSMNKNFEQQWFSSEVQIKDTFAENTRYFGRFVVQTKNGFVRYNVGEFYTPSACVVRVAQIKKTYELNILKTGNGQELLSLEFENKCKEDVEVSRLGLDFKVSLNGKLSNMKLCSRDTKKGSCVFVSSESISKFAGPKYFLLDKSFKVPAGGKALYDLTGDISGKINRNDYIGFFTISKPWQLVSLVDLKNSMNPAVSMLSGKYPTLIEEDIWQSFSK